MRLDSSGNLGLGVTPSAWSGFRALQVGGATSIWSSTSGAGSSFYSNNVYFNGTNRIRLNAGYATEYIQDSSAGAHIWFNAASSTAGSIISFTQAMTLDASGNLAVGTTTADAFGTNYKTVTLQGAGTNTGGVYVSRTSDSSINMYVGTGNSTSFVRTSTNHPLTFWTNDTERARITSGGDLLVGKTDPSYDVNGIALLPTQARFTAANTNPLIILRNGSDGTVADFWRGGTGIVGSISITTTSTAYNTSSDYRLKDNQQPLTGSGAFIDALQPKTWEWKTDGSRGVGFIAHEVQEVSPGSVVGTKDAVDEEGKPVMQAMEYGSAEFIANIVAELQSLRARVAQLESKGA
jgi:hypothetical protein